MCRLICGKDLIDFGTNIYNTKQFAQPLSVLFNNVYRVK